MKNRSLDSMKLQRPQHSCNVSPGPWNFTATVPLNLTPHSTDSVQRTAERSTFP